MAGIDFIQDLGLVMLVAAVAAWLCQRAGLPVVIGYISAGILIGPHTHSFALISNLDRIQSLAQVGLVFLIFSIGQGLRIQRLRSVGLPLIVATILIAALVLTGCRILGAALGWPANYSLVLGGMLMVSSTAVLGKTLREANATHRPFGQTALTITALDDMVAVITLTVLASLVHAGEAGSSLLVGSVVRLKAVLITMAVAALLLVPPLLNRVRRGASSEVGSLAIVGLLLAMALLSARAGFSAALGAFLLGTVVSSTGRAQDMNRVLGSMSEVFGPVFFVAMGMLFDIKLLLDVWPLALGAFAMAIIWRAVAATVALLMVGEPMGNAARAALCLTPIGEFSLIIALTGVQGDLVPPGFYAAAVGVCLLTSITTPILIRNSHWLSTQLQRKQPAWLAQWIGIYHDWIESLKQRQHGSVLWKLTAPRFLQVGMLVLFVSGLFIFARPIYGLAEKWLGPDWPFAQELAPAFWFILGAAVLAPLIALWRNIEALAMICAESASHGRKHRAVLQPLFERLLKGCGASAGFIWLAALLPWASIPFWSLIALTGGLLAIVMLFWRRIHLMQSRFEIELRTQLADSPYSGSKALLPGWPEGNGHWRMNLAEVTIRENTQGVACTISELPLRLLFSCTIVCIDRHGVPIANPPPDTILYPNDRVLLLGHDEQLRCAEAWLNSEAKSSANNVPSIADLSLKHLTVPASSRHAGNRLGDLRVHSQFGVQIVGIERGTDSVLSPGRKETLQPGDQLLVLGTPGQITDLAFWLST